jgi:hypothetical protein
MLSSQIAIASDGEDKRGNQKDSHHDWRAPQSSSMLTAFEA